MVELVGILIAVGCFVLAFGPDCSDGARLMSAGDLFGLVISVVLLVYLLYALFRGERL